MCQTSEPQSSPSESEAISADSCFCASLAQCAHRAPCWRMPPRADGGARGAAMATTLGWSHAACAVAAAAIWCSALVTVAFIAVVASVLMLSSEWIVLARLRLALDSICYYLWMRFMEWDYMEEVHPGGRNEGGGDDESDDDSGGGGGDSGDEDDDPDFHGWADVSAGAGAVRIIRPLLALQDAEVDAPIFSIIMAGDPQCYHGDIDGNGSNGWWNRRRCTTCGRTWTWRR